MMDIEQMVSNMEDILDLRVLLMRDLTDDETLKVLDCGKEKFLHDELKFDKADIDGLNTIRRIISSYCTRTSDEYEKELNADNLDVAYAALKTIVNDIEDRLKGIECPIANASDLKCDTVVKKRSEFIAHLLANLLTDLSKSESNAKWIKQYNSIDVDNADLISLLEDQDEDSKMSVEGWSELCSEAIDLIKDDVVKHWAEKLLSNKGKTFKLDNEIAEEVMEYIFDTEDNISIVIYNDKITVR